MPSRHRSEADKAKVRSEMMQAAGRLLSRDGYNGVTLAKVGKEVGFTTTNVYRYFDSKDDLIYAALEQAFVTFGQKLEEARQREADPVKRIHALGQAYLMFADAYPEAYHLMFVAETEFGGREVPGVDKLRYLTEAVAEGIDTGQIRNTNITALADSIWASVHGAVMLARVIPFIDQSRKEALFKEALTVVARALKPD